MGKQRIDDADRSLDLRNQLNVEINDQREKGWLPEDCISLDAPGKRFPFFAQANLENTGRWLSANKAAHEVAEAAIAEGKLDEWKAAYLFKQPGHPTDVREMIENGTIPKEGPAYQVRNGAPFMLAAGKVRKAMGEWAKVPDNLVVKTAAEQEMLRAKNKAEYDRQVEEGWAPNIPEFMEAFGLPDDILENFPPNATLFQILDGSFPTYNVDALLLANRRRHKKPDAA